MSVSAEDIRAINELKDALNKVAAMMNDMSERNLVVKFTFAPDKDGKQVVSVFQVMAPLDLSKTSS